MAIDADTITDEDLPRMGERLRLRKDVDISGFTPHVQTILKGLQRYGMFVADNGIDWAISVAPDPRIAGLHDELTVDDDVALVLWVGMPRRRGAAGEQELDQRVAAVDRLAGHANGRERPEEPQLLALAGSRPDRFTQGRAGHVPTLTARR